MASFSCKDGLIDFRMVKPLTNNHVGKAAKVAATPQ
jgi:hypothetical protein